MAPKAIPDRWEPYIPIGSPIRGTRFVALKVPLKEHVCANLEPKFRWTIDILTSSHPNIGMIVDFTLTTRYYDYVDFLNKGVDYCKVAIPGQQIPSEQLVKRFFAAVDYYLDRHRDGSLIGIHCTHGVNRTGYMIARYMIQRLGFSVSDALESIAVARGHPIERENYISDLGRHLERIPKCLDGSDIHKGRAAGEPPTMSLGVKVAPKKKPSEQKTGNRVSALAVRRRALKRMKRTILETEKQNEGLGSVQQTASEVVVIDSDSEVEEFREGKIVRSNFASDPFPGHSGCERNTGGARESVLLSGKPPTPENEDKLKPENDDSAIAMISGSSVAGELPSVPSSSAVGESTSNKVAIRVRDIATLMNNPATNRDDLNCAPGVSGFTGDTAMVSSITKSDSRVKDIPSLLSMECSSVENDTKIVDDPPVVPVDKSGVRVKDIPSLLSIDCSSNVASYAKPVAKNPQCRNINGVTRSFNNNSSVERRKESAKKWKPKNKKKSKRPDTLSNVPGQSQWSVPLQQQCKEYVDFSADTHPPKYDDSPVAMIYGSSSADEPSSVRSSTAVGEAIGMAIRVKEIATLMNNAVRNRDDIDCAPGVSGFTGDSIMVSPITKSGVPVKDIPSLLSIKCSSVVNNTKVVRNPPAVVPIDRSGVGVKDNSSLLSIDCSSATRSSNNSTVDLRKESAKKKKLKNKKKAKRPDKVLFIPGQDQWSAPPPQHCKEYVDFSADSHPPYFYSERGKGLPNQFQGLNPFIRDRNLGPPPSADTHLPYFYTERGGGFPSKFQGLNPFIRDRNLGLPPSAGTPPPHFYTEQCSSVVRQEPQNQYAGLNPFIRDRNLDPEVIREMRIERRKLKKVMKQQWGNFGRQKFAGNSVSREHRFQRSRVSESLQNLNLITSKTPKPVTITVDKAESNPAPAMGKAVNPLTDHPVSWSVQTEIVPSRTVSVIKKSPLASSTSSTSGSVVPDRTVSVIKESPIASSTSSTSGSPVQPPNVDIVNKESSKGVASPQTSSSAKMPWTELSETSWSSLFYN